MRPYTILIMAAVAIGWLYVTMGESQAGQACLYDQSQSEWQLSCTSSVCVICQDGECKRFNPGTCASAQ